MLRNPLVWMSVAMSLAYGTVIAAEQVVRPEWDTTEWKPNSGKDLEIVAPRLSTSPEIDGVLDEDCWNEAVRVGNFTEFMPEEGKKPEVMTEVLIGYDNKNLYIGFICYEDNVSKVRATLTNRDGIALFNNDLVGIFLDTFNDLRRAYEFAVNPYGVQMDGYQTVDRGEDLKFDTNWESAAKILNNRWEAELAIPFKNIRFSPKERQRWRVHLIRIRPRESREMLFWAPISMDSPNWLAQAGHLYINERIVGGERNIEFLPYIIVSQNGSLPDYSNPYSFHNQWPVASIGLSAKYGITSNLTLDLAINPDYSQIETDVAMIDVNTTFALWYPEKRPFFLEGKDIFETPIDVFYTRSINDPLLAAKLTGKVGRTSIGYVVASDEHTPWVVPFEERSFSISSSKRSLSNILRVKHDT